MTNVLQFNISLTLQKHLLLCNSEVLDRNHVHCQNVLHKIKIRAEKTTFLWHVSLFLLQDEEWCWTAKGRCWSRSRARAWSSRTTPGRWSTARPTAVPRRGSTGWWATARRSCRYRTSVRCWWTAPCTSCRSARRATGTTYTRPSIGARRRTASARCSAVKSRWRPVREKAPPLFLADSLDPGRTLGLSLSSARLILHRPLKLARTYGSGKKTRHAIARRWRDMQLYELHVRPWFSARVKNC